MAAYFFHTPDDLIQVGPYDGAFVMTLVEFLVEEPTYEIPAGATWQYYDDGDGIYHPEFHTLSDGSTQSAGVMPWAEGDDYLANWAMYQTNVEAARAAAAPDPPTNEEIADAMLDSVVIDSIIEYAAPLLTGAPSKATARAAIRAIIIAAL